MTTARLRLLCALTLVSLVAASLALLPAASAAPGATTLVSVASDGTQGNRESTAPAISADGRFVAFFSSASNLVGGDTNGFHDVFVHDRETGQTTRVSVASDGTQGNSYSGLGPALGTDTIGISADGRIVAFQSLASNLVGGDTNGVHDVFVHDRQTGQTSRVSVASDGTQADGLSVNPVISADGRFVAFTSNATNLEAGDTNGFADVFVYDRQTRQTTRVSVASDSTQGNSFSGYSHVTTINSDGRFVAFDSIASNLVGGDTNVAADVFVHDRVTGQTSRASVASDGTQANDASTRPTISSDGRFVGFLSPASNLVGGDTNVAADAFVHDRQSGQTSRVSVASDGTQANDLSDNPVISADSRLVTFASGASNLVSGDADFGDDVFVHDRQTGQTTLVSVALGGATANGGLDYRSSAISADGRYVAFAHSADNLVSGDSNGATDVFVHDRADVNAGADLAIGKADAPDPVLVGQALTYTLTVANNGPSPSTGVTVTDSLPADVTFGSATPSQGSCSRTGVTVSCDLGSLASGASATVEIVVTPTAAGPLTNTATTTGNEADPNTANNSATQTTTVNPSACPAETGFGQTISCRIEAPNEVDRLTVVSARNDVIQARVVRTSGTHRLNVSIYDANGKVRCSEPPPPVRFGSDVTTQCSVPTAGGEVRVRGDGATGTTGYNLSVQRLNNPGACTPVSFGSTTPGVIDPVGEDDCYPFVSARNDVIQARAVRTSGTGLLNVQIYDANGRLRCSEPPPPVSFGSDVTIPRCRVPTAGGHVRVSGDSTTATTGYDLSVQRL